MAASLGRRIAIGASWMVALQMADRAIGFVSIVILARLLVPEHFGLIAYAMTFIGLLEIFLQFGFQTVLIRDQDAPRESYDTAWTLNCIRGVLVAATVYCGGSAVADFFNEAELRSVLAYLALIPLMRGVENVGTVDFQKHMEFGREFLFNFVPRVVGTIVTITLAFTLHNHWALVIGMIAQAGTRVTYSFVACPFRPRLSLVRFGRVFGFSKWLLVQNIGYGLFERLPVLVLGRVSTAQAAGLYNMAFELSDLAASRVAAPIRKALFPGVAQLSDVREMGNALQSAIGGIALIGLPITLGVAAGAEAFVPLLLGEKWTGVIPVLQALSISAAARILYSNSHILLYTLDKPSWTAWISVAQVLLLVLLLLYFVPWMGPVGAALAVSLTDLAFMAVHYAVVFKFTELGLSAVIGCTWRSVVSGLVMAGAVYQIPDLVPEDWSIAVVAAVCIGAGALIYPTVLVLLWLLARMPGGPESQLMGVLSEAYGRVGARFSSAQ